MKGILVHLMNVFGPAAIIHHSENSVDVHTELGHAIALRKNGAGQLVDCSKEHGCYDEFSLEPIPKDARMIKLYPDGSIGKSEEFSERVSQRKKFLCKKGVKVLSMEELKKAGFKFDAKGICVASPKGLDEKARS